MIPELRSRSSSFAIAAPIPTPTAATGTLATPPVPNPLNFPGAQNQILLSAQYNTNFYDLWNYVSGLAGQLNSCNFAGGPDVTTGAGTYPVQVLVSPCNPGYGTTLGVSLLHGDYDDLLNAQTISGAKTYTAPVTIGTGAGAINLNGAFSSTATDIGGSGEGGLNLQVAASSTLGYRFFKWNGSALTQTAQLDNYGNFTIPGSLSALNAQIGPATPSTANFISHGQTGTYPYFSNVYNSNYHAEPNLIGATISCAAFSTCSGAGTKTFTTAFTSAPICNVTPQNSTAIATFPTYNSTTTGVTIGFFNASNATISGYAANVAAICYGS